MGKLIMIMTKMAKMVMKDDDDHHDLVDRLDQVSLMTMPVHMVMTMF